MTLKIFMNNFVKATHTYFVIRQFQKEEQYVII